MLTSEASPELERERRCRLHSFVFQLDVLFGNLTEMVEFQVEFLKTLEDGVRLVPDLEKLERVDQFKVSQSPEGKAAPGLRQGRGGRAWEGGGGK